MDSAVVVNDLSKTFGTQRAVDGVSFSLPQTGVIGFLGPNGAGKTTTLRMLAGYAQPSKGHITVAGYDVQRQRTEACRRIGFLPEHNPLYLDLYVVEALRLAGALQGMKGPALTARIEEVIALTGLSVERHKRLGQLSKGYRQRVGIAQAILHDPPVLILDEPTSGLDPNQLVDIRQLIRSLGQRACVIFSSHILSEVQAVADRVLIIQQGRLLLDAPLSELRVGGQSLELEVAQPGLPVEKLHGLSGVTAVETLAPTRFRIGLAAGADPRQAIFDLVVSEKNSLLALTASTDRLEDVFRELTR